MTNRKDLIDPAILRPGRFEVHIEIGIPDEKGRLDILKIHTSKLTKNNMLGQDVDLKEIAARIKNYTGAEIESVVKSANTFSMIRNHDLMNFQKQLDIKENAPVEMQDFEKGMSEVKPAFGVDEGTLESFLRFPLINYGKNFEKLYNHLRSVLEGMMHGELPVSTL